MPLVAPFYEQDGITLYRGNCADIIPQLLPVDVAVVDPPYGDTSLEWDKLDPFWPDLLKSVTSNLWCFGSFRMFTTMARDGALTDWKLAQEIIWEKQNGTGFHADRFKRVHELIVQYYRGDWRDIYKSPVTTPDATATVSRRKKRPPHMGDIGLTTFISHDGGPRLMRSVVYIPNLPWVRRSPNPETGHASRHSSAVFSAARRYCS